MAKDEDFLTFITQQFVTYFDIPVEARRERKQERKNRGKEYWAMRWFGIMPLGMKIWVGQWKYASKPLYKRVGQLRLIQWWRSAALISASSHSKQDEKPLSARTGPLNVEVVSPVSYKVGSTQK